MAGDARAGLRPLAFRDFRVVWAGMTVSLIGDGVMLVALAWQVFALSRTPAALALVGISVAVPQVGLALFGGVVSDRYERRRVMIAADCLRGVALLAAAVLAFTGALHLWHLLIIGAYYGAGSAFFQPAFDALVPDLVPPELLTEANSLDQLVRPLAARLVGPMIGGILIGAVGAGGAFGVDAVTFAISVVCLCRIGSATGSADRPAAKASSLADLRECLSFVRANAWLWGTLVSSSFACLLFLGPSEVLLPFVVKHDLHASARILGAVVAFGGLGAAAAAITIARNGLPRRHITLMYTAWTLATLGIAAYGIAHVAWQLMVACFAFNAFETTGLIAWATMRQRLVPRHLLGRVASLDWMVATGLLPISLALVGPAAAAFGVRTTMVTAGVLASVVTAAAYLMLDVREPEREADPLADLERRLQAVRECTAPSGRRSRARSRRVEQVTA